MMAVMGLPGLLVFSALVSLSSPQQQQQQRGRGGQQEGLSPNIVTDEVRRILHYDHHANWNVCVDKNIRLGIVLGEDESDQDQVRPCPGLHQSSGQGRLRREVRPYLSSLHFEKHYIFQIRPNIPWCSVRQSSYRKLPVNCFCFLFIWKFIVRISGSPRHVHPPTGLACSRPPPMARSVLKSSLRSPTRQRPWPRCPGGGWTTSGTFGCGSTSSQRTA